MHYYDNDIKEVLDALNACKVATKNLHTKYNANGLPLAIAQALELDIATTAQNLKVIIEMADKVRVNNAIDTLALAGYEVVAPKVTTPSSVDIAIALLVKNGYKVSDSQGRNY
jgi:CRISPR/Cas system-associated exonuclease Cas4 (RecB family)